MRLRNAGLGLLVGVSLGLSSCGSRDASPKHAKPEKHERPAPAPDAQLLPVIDVDAPVDADTRLTRRLRQDVLPAVRREDPLRLTIDLVQQPDLVAISRTIEADHPSRAARKQRTWDALAGLDARRADFVAWLEAQPGVHDVRAFRSVNRVSFDGNESIARAAAERKDVAAIWGQRRTSTLAASMTLPEHVRGRGTTWDLDAVGARRAWAKGLRGKGVVVAVMDSGVTGEHPELAGRLSGSLRPEDLKAATQDPGGGHGTAVLAAAVGKTIGVAPDAQWTAVDPIGVGQLDPEAVAAACDWLLSSARPDVVVVPWDSPQEGPVHQLRIPLGALRTAGMAMVFAAGNEGPVFGENEPPANLVKVAPDGATALSVGGIDAAMAVYQFSCRGPNASDGSTFPSIVAPATALSIADAASGDLREGNGTSFAAGVVAGALALVMSARPELSGPQAEKLVRDSAKDLGAPGPDNEMGYGLVDIDAALAVRPSR
jgi:subtilisin family serine protease